jgi:D-alanyl-D-alanine carboxypeptidase/D-alanyl-D-alanine-endopeptidase (penicillin-binding protein 4)
MKKFFFVAGCWLLVTGSFAQDITQKLEKAYREFEADSQLRHAVSSLYVIDAKTGKIVFDKNSQTGLAGASTQKIITAVTAFELLGREYKYKTEVRKKAQWTYIVGYGDPTLGSWRFNKEAANIFFANIISALKKKKTTVGQFRVADPFYDKLLPGGWIYEDIGNYYGANAFGLNWHENQYDLTFLPGQMAGEPTELDTTSFIYWRRIDNKIKTGTVGSGDNAYIYFIPFEYDFYVRGTVPAGVKKFTISGADPNPECSLSFSFLDYCKLNNMWYENEDGYCVYMNDSSTIKGSEPIYVHYSPSLDSIIYWFLKKSINLYGEALIKTFAYEKKGFGSTDSGIVIVKDFWKQKGIDEDELNIYDGSGLSPLNRITTHAQVEILKYAKTKDWFPYFYDALPEYNGMKIKSGTISDVKGFCGYHKAGDGNEYIFSFLVNNYNGPSSAIVNKMYKVLDVLK